MAFKNISLAGVEKYKGINLCPVDFDRYWDKALAALDNRKPEPELVLASFQAAGAECFDLFSQGQVGRGFMLNF